MPAIEIANRHEGMLLTHDLRLIFVHYWYTVVHSPMRSAEAIGEKLVSVLFPSPMSAVGGVALITQLAKRLRERGSVKPYVILSAGSGNELELLKTRSLLLKRQGYVVASVNDLSTALALFTHTDFRFDL